MKEGGREREEEGVKEGGREREEEEEEDGVKEGGRRREGEGGGGRPETFELCVLIYMPHSTSLSSDKLGGSHLYCM